MKHITVGEYEYRYNDALNVIEFRGGPYNTTEWRESMYHPTKIRALHELLPKHSPPGVPMTRCRRHALTSCEECTVTRVEVIDHRKGSDTFGRAFVAWNISATLSYQDNGRTLKVFVDDPTPRP